MIRVKTVIEKLRIDCTPEPLRVVGGSGDLAGITDVLKFSNTAFVIPKSDRAAPSDSAVSIRQRTQRVFSVILGFTKQRVRTSESDLDNIEDSSEAVKAALIGWTPEGENSPVSFVGAGIARADYDQGFVLWACDFACPYYVRAIAE
ncbi:MAG TPA: hypothetical protein VGG48_14245 [Rhizomicrobium sp.]|jgi:hypothetical protein